MKYNQHNPFPDILDKIPYTKSVLDVNLMDDLRLVFYEKTKKMVPDVAILLSLTMLHEAGYVSLEYIDPVDAVGRIHFIKKVLNVR